MKEIQPIQGQETKTSLDITWGDPEWIEIRKNVKHDVPWFNQDACRPKEGEAGRK
jgi:hypothetical protein